MHLCIDMHISLALCIIIILIILSMIYMNKIIVYKYGSGNKKIVILAGVHGNEPAGPITINKLIEEKYFEKLPITILTTFKIIIIPRANEWGLTFGSRYGPTIIRRDINRNFKNENSHTKISKVIAKYVDNSFLVLDFHEGWGYVTENKGSIGSSISPVYNKHNKWVGELSKDMINKLNKNIFEIHKKFKILDEIDCEKQDETKDMLSCRSYRTDTNYILIETSGQNNIQPMYIRELQIRTIMDLCFDRLHKNFTK